MYLIDVELLDTVGVGDIHLKMLNSSIWKIHKVRHVSKLMHNLILVGQLDDEGYNDLYQWCMESYERFPGCCAREQN